MKQTQHYTKATIAVFAALGLLTGCNWVDSAGRQSNSKPTIILDDGTPDDGFSLNLNEEAIGTIDPSKSSDGDGAIISWTWDKATVAAGALSTCNTVDGFNSSLAAQSLNDACTDSDQCEVKVETEEVEKTEAEIAENQASLDALGSTAEIAPLKTVFTLTAPKLKAPVGVTYRIVAKDNDGGTGFAEVTLCLVAINEAPDAVDDNFTVLEGVPKEVLGTDPVNLLSNDSDDIDVSNQVLSVNPVAISNPQTSDGFLLGTDGGFNYYFPGDPANPAGKETFDTFEYEIQDGIHTSQAKVTLRIVSIDDAPVLNSSIPDFKFFEGIAQTADFGKYFSDPEGATLVFSETSNSLPPSFDRAQLSKGFLKSTPKRDEVDQYSLVLSASDDSSTTSDSSVLTIVRNQPPSFGNIANQTGTIGKFFSLDIAKYTNDPEGQPLTYNLVAGPNFFKMDGSVLKGTPNSSNSWKVTIAVSDNYNTPETESFTFTVVNGAPVLKRSIPDQTASVGQNFSFDISSYFSDPEGQKLKYTLTARPTYLSINNNGVISGKLSKVDKVNITVRASDGEKSVSDTFTLRVNNPPPVLSSKITNRTYTAGDVVSNVNIAKHFRDPNGDKLTFTSKGLPGSKQIKISSSGIMSGSATTTDAGSYNITVTASDGNGSAAGTFTLVINKKPNTPPKLTSSGKGALVREGQTVSFTSKFQDADAGDKITITANTGGSGLAFKQQGNDAVVSGTANKIGTFTIRITAKDNSGASAVDQYSVKVESANRAPTISKRGSGGTVSGGTAVSYKTTFSDPDSDPLTITATTGGSGLAFEQQGNSGVVSGKANKAGTFTIKVTAKDPSGASVIDQYTVKVEAANSAPTITSKGTGGTVANGTNVSYKTTFSDPNSDPLTISWDLDGSGFSANKSGNSVVVSGKAINTGTNNKIYTIKVAAKDPGNLAATDSYNVVVTPTASNNAPYRVTKGISKVITLGQATGDFVSVFADDDGIDNPLTLTINKGGANFLQMAVSGNKATVSGVSNIVGVFDIVVTATDRAGLKAIDGYKLTVNPAP